jgi:PAS domain S-box-containing protein
MEKTRINILIIEDNAGDLRLITEMLKESASVSFDISPAEIMKDAEQLIAVKRFDVAILDLNLPDSYGFEGLEKITSLRPGLPVIVLTGIEDEAIGLEAVQKHASDFLVKGQINSALLVKSIRYAIERKRFEELIRHAKEDWERTFDTVPDLITVLDKEHRIIRLNKAMAARLGISPKEAIGLHCFEVVHGSSQPLDSCPHVLTCQDNHEHSSELFEQRLGGDFLVSTTPMCNTEGVLIGSIHVARDITARKKAEEILKRDKKMLEQMITEKSREMLAIQQEVERAKRLADIGTLAATVAHELRNPLATIRLAAYNVKKKVEDPALQKRLNTIDQKVLESDQIINNLLFYSRLKSPQVEKVDIYGLLNEVCENVCLNNAQKEFTLNKKFNALKDELMEADPLQLKELFANVLNNSCDAITDKSGVIEIKAKNRENKYANIEIRDNGVGIEKENMERILEPFFSTKSKGTGLGLTVCQQIIKLHDGSIALTSEKGKGTVVTIKLPFKRVNTMPKTQ